MSEFRFVGSGQLHKNDPRNHTNNRTNKAASCGFMDRFPSQPISQDQEAETLRGSGYSRSATIDPVGKIDQQSQRRGNRRLNSLSPCAVR